MGPDCGSEALFVISIFKDGDYLLQEIVDTVLDDVYRTSRNVSIDKTVPSHWLWESHVLAAFPTVRK